MTVTLNYINFYNLISDSQMHSFHLSWCTF